MDYFIKPAHAAVNLGDYYAFGRMRTLGELIGTLVPLAMIIGGILVSFYIMLGAYYLIISWGDKTAVANARNQIIHGIIGFVLLIAMFVILKFLPTGLGLDPGFDIIGM